ncbi:MAG TPA: excinuclease ABC subunit UvrC [Candidatus Acidoferrales bacterium]|nr:excinuclease ABC subunit UvrC [Candidatus Acidoferrales bacterium]
MSALAEKIANLPAVPGVYLFKDARGQVLYVGKAASLAARVRSYLAHDPERPRMDEMMERATDLDTILTDTEAEALLLESTLIRQHRPHYNVLLKDDKSFPFVKLSMQDEFPRLSVTRRVRQDGARYLGPFTDVKNLRRALRDLRRIFPLRTCRNFEDYRRQDRPCLYFHIKRCAGPCYSRAHVDPTAYRGLAEGLVLLLSGRNDELLARLRAEMADAAGARRYELAAQRRDQIRLLERAQVPQKMVTGDARDTDVLGVARHGERAALAALLVRGGRVIGKDARTVERAGALDDAALVELWIAQHALARSDLPRRILVGRLPGNHAALAEALSRRAGHAVELVAPVRGRARRLLEVAEKNAAAALEQLAARAAGRRARFSPAVLGLQRELGLGSPPHRMVCFDISNFGADQAVAAVVASEEGRPLKSLYRRMRVRRPGPDDFAMIGEAVERYWTRVESGELPRPDLVVIDGGAGQLSAAREALGRIATRPVSLIALAKREELIVREGAPDLRLPRRSPALRALQRLRDEAHRFGLTYHRTLRSRARIGSALDHVSGVGPARRAALLKAFGSVAAMREASPETIAERARVPLALARRVAEHLAHLEGAA